MQLTGTPPRAARKSNLTTRKCGGDRGRSRCLMQLSMNRRHFISTTVTAAAATASLSAAEGADTACYEFRTYTAAEGKLDALHARFRDHTLKLFEKHGMVNLGYWVPLENPDRKLLYLLRHASKAAKDASWKGFIADPEWKKAAADSEKDGRLVAKIESLSLHTADYSPAVKAEKKNPPRTFELRIYTTTAGNLPRLHERFRNHTCKLFTKHGMSHFGYWELDAGQPGADNTLFYLLAHASKEACAASFKAFRGDPEWIKVREASEKAAGGSLTVPDGVKSVLLTPTDYSPAC